jgi:hypothetical protein
MNFDLSSTAQTTIVVLTAMTLVGGSLTWAGRKARKGFHYMTEANELIRAQLSPNGGSSLVDMVKSSATAVEQIAPNHLEAIQHWKDLAAADQEHADKLDAQENKMDVLSESVTTLTDEFMGVKKRQDAAFRVIRLLFLEQSPERQEHLRKLAEAAAFELDP